MLPLDRLKITGRWLLNGGVIWLSSSAAEVSFTVKDGSRLTVTLAGDDTARDPERETNRARYEILVNGQSLGRYLMSESTRTHTLADGAEARALRVRIVKLSEAQDSSLGVVSVDTDGEISPAPKKPLKIEFIGDSITCAYGVEGTLDKPYSTVTENALFSYAVLAANALNADYQLTAFSGFGIVSAYTESGVIDRERLVPSFYGRVGTSRACLPGGAAIQDAAWDFSVFQPDFVVINLGTNDMSYCRDDAEKIQRYSDEYVEFLKSVRAHNPGARILCLLGIMGEALCPAMEAAAAKYRALTGDTRVRALSVADQRPEDGYGTAFHPSPITHQKLAGRVTDALASWTREED